MLDIFHTQMHTMASTQPHFPRPAYGHCSSSFVESDGDGVYIQRYEARKRAEAAHQAASNYVQEQIADQLSLVTSDDYQDDILQHMEHMESTTLPDVNSIDIQSEIQWYMRPYLMDFLIEAHAAFGLLEETLHLTVNLLDRYCSKRIVYKRHYQLVGCAALLIAAKYGDRKDRVPTVRELKSMCCSLYEEEMFTQMEWHVLVTLDWTIGHPTVDSYLQLCLSDDPSDLEVEHLSWFICEMALYRRDFVSTPPSIMAKCSLTLARYMLSKLYPTEADSELLNYPTFILLAQMVQAEKSQVLVKKYSSPQYSSVSQTLELFLMRQAQMQRQGVNATPVNDMSKEQLGVPHTPQKMLGETGMPYGYMTPPITPESVQSAAECYAKPVHPHVQQLVSTLTPPPSSRVGRESTLRFSHPPPSYHMPAQLPHLPSQMQQPGLYGQ